MTKNLLLLCVGLLSLCSCNLWGGIDKPSGDDQLLSAARGAFDRGDYTQALEYYQQLSASKNDVRLSESALVSMAQAGIFSVQDLVASLGDNRGGGSSFSKIANLISDRGRTGASYRTQLDQLYVNAGAITDVRLRSYTRFLIALAMTNQVLANAVGADGTLTESDLASNPSTCRSTPLSCSGAGTALTDSSAGGNPGTWTGTSVDANWGNPASIDMLIIASDAADTNFAALTGGTGQGITQALSDLQALGVLGANAKRAGVLTTIFSQ